MVLAFGYSRETGTTGRTGFHSFDKRHTLCGGYYRSGIRDGADFKLAPAMICAKIVDYSHAFDQVANSGAM